MLFLEMENRSMSPSIRKNIAIIFLGFLGLGLGWAFVVNVSILSAYRESDKAKNFRQLHPAEAAIVPGASVQHNQPSLILQDRLQAAVELYRHGMVRKILLSGDNGSIYYNEVKPMLIFVLEKGIPEKDVFVDHAGFRTLDTIVRAREIFRVETAIFVSQKFHQPRAAYIAAKTGLKMQSLESDRRIFESETYNQLREFFARNLAWLDLNLLHRSPKYLGEPYPIGGDGRRTWKGSVL